MVQLTNPAQETGTLADALNGADIFVGVSAPGIVSSNLTLFIHAAHNNGRRLTAGYGI